MQYTWYRRKGKETHIDELLQVIVQVCKILPPLLVLCNKLLFALQKFLALLLQGLALAAFILDARDHEGIFVGFFVPRVFREELFDGNEWQLLVLVAMIVALGQIGDSSRYS